MITSVKFTYCTQGEYPPRMLVSAVLSLTTPTHPKREDLAIRTLLITHHPVISKWLFVKTILVNLWNVYYILVEAGGRKGVDSRHNCIDSFSPLL